MEYLFGFSAMMMVVAALAPHVVDVSKALFSRTIAFAPVVPVKPIPPMKPVAPIPPVKPLTPIHRHEAGQSIDHPWFR